MARERVVAAPPDQDELYERIHDRRQGRGALLGRAGVSSLQDEIDLLQRDNADLRWAHNQRRQQAALTSNPPAPSRNRAP
jgi:hypothetical protein